MCVDVTVCYIIVVFLRHSVELTGQLSKFDKVLFDDELAYSDDVVDGRHDGTRQNVTWRTMSQQKLYSKQHNIDNISSSVSSQDNIHCFNTPVGAKLKANGQ